MAFNIQDFITNLDQNNMTSHANMFDVVMTLPAAIGDVNASRELSLVCEAAEFPGIDVAQIQYRHYGFSKYIPHALTFTPLNLTFYCTGQMTEKRIFDAWVNLCVDVTTGLVTYRLDSNGQPNYETTITINQYDPIGDYTYFAQAEEAFPISVSPLMTNWSDDSVHRVSVQFIFTKWKNIDEGVPGASTNVSNPGVPFASNFTNLLNNITRTATNPNIIFSNRGLPTALNGIYGSVNGFIPNSSNPLTNIFDTGTSFI